MGDIFPYLSDVRTKERYSVKFGGINRSDGTPLGEWEELCNMDFSHYPALSSSRPKGYNVVESEMTGCVYKNGVLQYTVPDGIYIDGTKYPLTLSEGEKRLVCMGAYIVILPDFIVCNTAGDTPEFNDAASPAAALTGTLTEVNRDWTVIDTKESTKDKLLYLTVSAEDPALEKYAIGDKVLAEWVHDGKQKSAYMTIQSILKEGDATWVSKGNVAVHFETDLSFPDIDYFYLEDAPQSGIRFSVGKPNSTVRKYIPKDMDFVIEHNNRLWGCSSKNHEIYCSKLGDPTCWGDFQGISTDSWAVTVGSDGDFTGAAVYNGKVLFFKEDCLHTVYGTKASNFTLSTVKLRGVKKGCHDSLCISNGLLYYKAPEGIFVYNGTTSQKADARLGEDITLTAAACADDRKIYMLTSDGAAKVYDCVHGCWSTETAVGAKRGFNVNGCLYALCKDENGMRTVLLSGNESMAFCENEVKFYAQTGWLNSESSVMSCFSKIKLAVGLIGDPEKTKFRVLVKYSDGEEWTTAYSFNGKLITREGGIFTVPIIPMRAHRIKLRIEGSTSHDSKESVHAGFLLYGLYLSIEEGTEIGGEH